MSKETPKEDPRQRTGWGSHTQTDKPWKGNPEKEQKERGRRTRSREVAEVQHPLGGD